MKRILSVMGLLAPIVFLLFACGETNGTPTSSATTSGPPSVHITEADFHIASSLTNFVPGMRYHFVIMNHGQTTHEFMIMPKSEGAMNGMAMSQMDKLALAAVENIQPGATFDGTQNVQRRLLLESTSARFLSPGRAYLLF